MNALQTLVARLREPDGCPWDRMQTEHTIKMYLLEEAYEVLDAIDGGTSEDLCQELGDLLFQILFLARLAEEKGDFDLLEVMERITQKMIHRHPHVFGPTQVQGAEEVSRNWERLKREEKGAGEEDLASGLEGVPNNLPALLRAHRLLERASKGGAEGQAPREVWSRVTDNIRKIQDYSEEMGDTPPAKILGELLFLLAAVAREWGLNAEHLLREHNSAWVSGIKGMEEEK